MKKVIFIILIIILFIFVYVNVNASVIIPGDAIRVRVVPNSNSVIDQSMKEKVKNYVSNYMMLKLDGVTDVKEARDIINDNIKEVNDNIKELFDKNDYDMDFYVSFGNNYLRRSDLLADQYDHVPVLFLDVYSVLNYRSDAASVNPSCLQHFPIRLHQYLLLA